MASKKQFLIGNGQVLSTPVVVPSSFGQKRKPYTFNETKSRLLPLFEAASSSADSLPPKACPEDNVVAMMTLHPSYLAKSYFPQELLHAAGLFAVGSRSREIVPKTPPPSRSRKKTSESPDDSSDSEPKTYVTTQLFVAGPRESYRNLGPILDSLDADSNLADEFLRIEDLRIPDPEDRIRPMDSNREIYLLEAVLHSAGLREMVINGFKDYLNDLDVDLDLSTRFETDSLSFLRIQASANKLSNIAKYSFLRVLREMPRLRQFRPLIRDVPGADSFAVVLPSEDAVDKKGRVAIFDGGLPENHGLGKWATGYDTDNLSSTVAENEVHGLAVTSAFLFGSLDDGLCPPRPPMNVDHYRVLDDKTNDDPQHELYEVLDRIKGVLEKTKYDFVNLSIGPDLPVEDDDPSAWTSILDEHFGGAKLLASVAVGNRGDENPDTGYNRIQPPSDCVNALGVGASDVQGTNWKRAKYSCIGPGRCPGFVKPDIVAFGGSNKEPFWTLDANRIGQARAVLGTSFAAPNALRLGVSARAHFGNKLGPLAIKALLIHRAVKKDISKTEIGWGKIPEDVEDLMLCAEGEVHILYQGVLTPKKWIRIPIPLPEDLNGFVTLSVTLCYATSTDPQDPINYTRNGVEVRFRPHDEKRKSTEQYHANSASLFGKTMFGVSEQELRDEAHKWETVLHYSKRLRSTSLSNPVLDVHHLTRQQGRSSKSKDKLPYALVVTVNSPKTEDIYNKTMLRYPVLQQIRPIIQIPVRV